MFNNNFLNESFENIWNIYETFTSFLIKLHRSEGELKNFT